MLLEGKTALITGAGRGIGQGIALAFARQGCDVALTARSADELEDTASQVSTLGRRAVVVPCDVSDPAAVTSMADAAVAALGGVDILVNNAGYACFKPFEELSLDEWRRTLDVNVTGVYLVTRALLPALKASASGRIINIGSVAGLKPIANQSAYVASKHALTGLSETLALELKPHRIAVHCLCPGGVTTRLAEEAMPERDKSNWMTPEDIAHAALFLATMSGRATTDTVVIRRFDSSPIGG